MKTITRTFKFLLSLSLVLGISKAYSQGCLPSFTYVANSNGVVNFMSTSTGVNSITTQYYWTFTGGSPSTFTGTGGAGMVASSTYTASGIYTVNLFIMTVPSCSNAISQTIAINIAPTPTCAITINTTAASGTNICNGTLTVAGSATVANVTGLCGPPSFTWMPGGQTGPAAFQLCPNTVYTVVASGGSGTNCCTSVSQTFAINTNTCPLNASFNYSLGANGLVNFYNSSTGTNSVLTSYNWFFGNGQVSNAQNPSTTYTANGQYLVVLHIQNGGPACSDSTSVLVNVNNVSGGPCNLVASFNNTNGANGLVNFQSTSTGVVNPATYFWVFGNGLTSTAQNPSTTYTANGSYTVMLAVMNGGTNTPNCTDSVFQVVNVSNVTGPCNLSASFSHTVGANGVVNFASSSSGTIAGTVYYWNFGDGTTGFGIAPNHTYPSSGPYFVIMTAINNSVNCMSTSSMAINVTGLPCLANANFSVAPTNTAQFWVAIPSFPWNINNAVWSWGDGSSSNGLYSSHSYSAAGMYSICLTVTATCGSTAQACASYSIFKVNTSQAIININVVAPELIETGLSDQHILAEDVKLYPNPGNGLFYLESSRFEGELGVRVIDLQGKELSTLHLNKAEIGYYQADLRHLNEGIYLMVLQQGKTMLHKKLIITKD